MKEAKVIKNCFQVLFSSFVPSAFSKSAPFMPHSHILICAHIGVIMHVTGVLPVME